MGAFLLTWPHPLPMLKNWDCMIWARTDQFSRLAEVDVIDLRHACGHSQQAFEGQDDALAELDRMALSVPCPDCCRMETAKTGQYPAVFVNLQRLSDEMSAFVLEVTDVGVPLTFLLQDVGYAKRARSVDELTPGGTEPVGKGSVWRKEFWFAAATSPLYVLALHGLVKDEVTWLSRYLPDSGAIHFLDFPEACSR